MADAGVLVEWAHLGSEVGFWQPAAGLARGGEPLGRQDVRAVGHRQQQLHKGHRANSELIMARCTVLLQDDTRLSAQIPFPALSTVLHTLSFSRINAKVCYFQALPEPERVVTFSVRESRLRSAPRTRCVMRASIPLGHL